MKTPPNPEQALLVLTTFPDEKVARSIAGQLVEEKLAACVSVLPGLRSIYFWQDAVQDDTECLGLLKTGVGTYEALERRLLELHPYEAPEVLAIDIARGSADYLKWIAEVLAK